MTRFLLIVFLDLINKLLNLPTHCLIVVSSCLLRPVTEDHLCEVTKVTMRENSTFFTFTSWNRSGRIMISLASFKARDWFSTFGYCGHVGRNFSGNRRNTFKTSAIVTLISITSSSRVMLMKMSLLGNVTLCSENIYIQNMFLSSHAKS